LITIIAKKKVGINETHRVESGVSTFCRRAQRQRGDQNIDEASLLSKSATTQQTRVRRLRPEDKGDLTYISFRADYRNKEYSLSDT
jgi:hypothetical protein